ncbi:MAG: LEA type 2 family protein [Bacteroidales bacterium]|nr:LEA type 2 family protein [Bacteroidales bacterium]
MIRLKSFLPIVFLLLVTSCANLSEIEIGEVNYFAVKGFEDNALMIAVTVPVENPTVYKFTVSDIDSRVYLDDHYLGKISSFEPLEIPRRSNAYYTIDLKIRLANFLGTALKVMSLREGQKIKVRFEGEITAKSFLLKKRIPFDEVRKITI